MHNHYDKTRWVISILRSVMDAFTQIPEKAIELEEEFGSLTNSLKLHGITTVDLINYSQTSPKTLSSLSQKIGRSLQEIQHYIKTIRFVCNDVFKPNKLAGELNLSGASQNGYIPSGHTALDKALFGGIRKGCITEIFGQSGTGKTQVLMQITASCLRRREKCVFISTDSRLETRRLMEIISDTDSVDTNTMLENLSCIYCHDYETFDHVLFTQLPALIKADSAISLIVIDSIAHHLRTDKVLSNANYLRNIISETENKLKESVYYKKIKPSLDRETNGFFKATKSYKYRVEKSRYLLSLFRHINSFCLKKNIAVIVSNQVSDYASSPSEVSNMIEPSPFSLNYQLGFYSGWDNITIFKNQNVLERCGSLYEDNTLIDDRIIFTDDMHTSSKRRKIESASSTPQRFRSDEETIQSMRSKRKKIIEKIYSVQNCETNRIVPTLGYQWSKLVTTRIMLMKRYVPNLGDEKTNGIPSDLVTGKYLTYSNGLTGEQHLKLDRQNMENDLHLHSSVSTSSIGSGDSIEYPSGWVVERYIKIVASPFEYAYKNYAISQLENKLPFTIGAHGIENV